jgi:hypothetical protein
VSKRTTRENSGIIQIYRKAENGGIKGARSSAEH